MTTSTTLEAARNRRSRQRRRRILRSAVLSGAVLIAAPVLAQSTAPATLPRGLPTDRPLQQNPLRQIPPQQNPLQQNPRTSQLDVPGNGSRPLTNAPEPGLLPAAPGGRMTPGAYGAAPHSPGAYGAGPYGSGAYGPGAYGTAPPPAGLPGMPPAGGPGSPPLPPDPADWYFDRPPAYVRDYSWIYVDAPRPQEIKVHDIITIVVNEKARFDSNSQFNRTRNATLKAELKEFIRLGKTGNLNTAASNQPTIDTNLSGRLQSNGQAVDAEGVNYRIAATVVDVLPNGYLVLEARKSIRTNRDLFEYSLTGTLRPDDISPRNEAYSEDIANLQVVRSSRGKIYNSTKRPWGLRLYDLLFPF